MTPSKREDCRKYKESNPDTECGCDFCQESEKAKTELKNSLSQETYVAANDISSTVGRKNEENATQDPHIEEEWKISVLKSVDKFFVRLKIGNQIFTINYFVEDKHDAEWMKGQRHSRARHGLGVHGGKVRPIYADMRLYEEIIFLQSYFKGKFCVENVQGYYKPLIEPQIVGRHYYWSNFFIPKIKVEPSHITSQSMKFPKRTGVIRGANIEDFEKKYGYNLSKYKIVNKRLLLRNCVEPEIGKHIFDSAYYNEGLFNFNPSNKI